MKNGLFASLVLAYSSFIFAQEGTVKVEGLPPAPNFETVTTESSILQTTQNATSTSPGQNESKLKDIFKNKKFEDQTEITDAKLKAENGSLSKYSLKFNFGYSGPPTSNFDSSTRPNIDPRRKALPVTLSGSFSGKYRVSSDSNFAAGSGITANDPMHGQTTYNTNDPFVSYSLLSRVNGMQMSHVFKAARVTTPNWNEIGEDGSFNYDNWLVYDLGTSKFALEFDTGFGYYFYNRGPNLDINRKTKKVNFNELTSNRYSISFVPILKYRITGKLSLETSVGFSYTNYRTTEDLSAWNQSQSTQRIGIGYAITRDIYISPYISFYPDQFSPDLTSFNFSTSFSLL